MLGKIIAMMSIWLCSFGLLLGLIMLIGGLFGAPILALLGFLILSSNAAIVYLSFSKLTEKKD